jgi:hypothetical protein
MHEAGLGYAERQQTAHWRPAGGHRGKRNPPTGPGGERKRSQKYLVLLERLPGAGMAGDRARQAGQTVFRDLGIRLLAYHFGQNCLNLLGCL